MLTVMVTMTLVSVLLGGIFQAFVLIPASLISLAVVCALSLNAQFSVGAVVLLAIGSLTILQFGYLLGSAITVTWFQTRTSGSSARLAPTKPDFAEASS